MRTLLRHVPVVAFTAFVLALSACGQRGPLYLPDEAPTEVNQNPPPATPAPETTPAPDPAATPAPEESKDTERKPDEKPR